MMGATQRPQGSYISHLIAATRARSSSSLELCKKFGCRALVYAVVKVKVLPGAVPLPSRVLLHPRSACLQ